MDWKTWTKVSGVILFIIAVAGFYLGNFYNEGSVLEIQNFPSSSELSRLKATEDYTLTFSIYNTGDETAFVDVISVSTQPSLVTELDPASLSIESKQTKDVQVHLSALGKEEETNIVIVVYYGDGESVSQKATLQWKS